MFDLKSEINRLKKLMAKMRMYETVSNNLRDGKNGFFANGMKRSKNRLLKEIEKDRN